MYATRSCTHGVPVVYPHTQYPLLSEPEGRWVRVLTGKGMGQPGITQGLPVLIPSGLGWPTATKTGHFSVYLGKAGPNEGPNEGHYHDDVCNDQTGLHQHLEVQQQQQWRGWQGLNDNMCRETLLGVYDGRWPQKVDFKNKKIDTG